MTDKANPGEPRANSQRLPGRDDDEACDPSCEPTPGPVREAGGTTGAGNLSPGVSNRTGGATSGVSPDDPRKPSAHHDVPPGA
jgi:hypothetical protein